MKLRRSRPTVPVPGDGRRPAGLRRGGADGLWPAAATAASPERLRQSVHVHWVDRVVGARPLVVFSAVQADFEPNGKNKVEQRWYF